MDESDVKWRQGEVKKNKGEREMIVKKDQSGEEKGEEMDETKREKKRKKEKGKKERKKESRKCMSQTQSGDKEKGIKWKERENGGRENGKGIKG